MRIISGKYKSRLIRFPRTRETRPMMDRMKETIFNILGEIVLNAKVLDLFCGSGSLGLEAISRGAREVLFIDSEELPCRTVKDNLRTLKISPAISSVSQTSFSQAIRHLAKKGQKFDLLFLDPPYNKGLIKKLLHQLERFDIVQNHGTIVIHRARQEPLPPNNPGFQIIREVEMGQAYVTFLGRINGNDKDDETN